MVYIKCEICGIIFNHKNINKRFCDECFNHNVTVQNISQSEDIDIAKAHLLCTELCDIVISICQNSNINEDEYIELLFNQINDWIDEGYNILAQYDVEVGEDGEESSEG